MVSKLKQRELFQLVHHTAIGLIFTFTTVSSVSSYFVIKTTIDSCSSIGPLTYIYI